MNGQLDWDGVVLPIDDVSSWMNVLTVAKRLQGLQVNGDFFVTYKDDEGNLIEVKHQGDLDTAIVWAQEQGVPCLCLHVPFESPESDSDESWMEVEPDSKPATVRDQEEDSVYQRQYQEREDADRSQEETPVAEGSIEQVQPEEELSQPMVESVDDAVEQGHAEATKSPEEQTEHKMKPAVEEQTEVVEEQIEPVEEQAKAVEQQFEVPAGNGNSVSYDVEEIMVEEQKVADAFQAEREEKVAESVQEESVEGKVEEQVTPGDKPAFVLNILPEIMEEAEDVEPNVRCIDEQAIFEASKTLPSIDEESVPLLEAEREEEASSPSNLDRFVELLYYLNGSKDSVVPSDVIESVRQILADSDALKNLIKIVQDSRVQQAISAIAKADLSKEDAFVITATTQLIKLVSRMPEFTDMIAEVPNLESVVMNFLRMTKGKKQVHPNVVCNGCDEDVSRAEFSSLHGHRTPDGVVRGLRYKSATLADFDLCESCEQSGIYQNLAGPFLKIVDPTQAPELILCALPGATSGMMSQIESLDWRNPIAKEFLEFVQNRQRRAFPQRRTPSQNPEAKEAPKSEVVEDEVKEAKYTEAEPVPVEDSQQGTPKPIVRAFDRQNAKCKHLLKTFETPHKGFTCDICTAQQDVKSVMHGCRSCNFDVCQACHVQYGFDLQLPTISSNVAPIASVAIAAAPQAKFVSDVTLADGCVVRPGESLTKTWRIRNSGADKWLPGTRIAHVGGDALGGPVTGVDVPLAAPGEAVNVSVPLLMPVLPGRYTSYWRLMTPHPTNAKFGHRFWVTVNVVPTPVVPQQPPRMAPPPPTNMRLMPHQSSYPPPPTVSRAAPVYYAEPPRATSYMPNSVEGGYLAGSPAVLSRTAPLHPMNAPVHDESVIPVVYEAAVAQITEIGFSDIDKIVKLLRECKGDTSSVIDRLCNNE